MYSQKVLSKKIWQKLVFGWQDQDPDPDVNVTVPRIRIRTNMSQIHNTDVSLKIIFFGKARGREGGGEGKMRN